MGNNSTILVHKTACRNRYGVRITHLGAKPEPASALALHRSGWRHQLPRSMETGKYFGQRQSVPVQGPKPVGRVPWQVISGLQKQLPQQAHFIRQLRSTNWVVYAKEPFAGPEQVIEYLGRYTHKVAIGNHRLVKVDESGVTFRWRDYRDNREKVMTLKGAEFLRRFCQHILPPRFVRIRHYGLLSTSRRPELHNLQAAFGLKPVLQKPRKHWKELCRQHLGYDPDLCPCCGKGIMITIAWFEAGRPPPQLPETIKTNTMNA